MKPKYIRIAEEMLKGSIPESLQQILDDTNTLCRRAGGQLVSRQIIAAIIVSEHYVVVD